MMLDPKPAKPGDIRLWRRRAHNLGEWTLRCDDLTEAVTIADYTAREGWPWPPARLTIQRLGEDGEWSEVPETELAAVRAEEGL
jgi:hypothetical protein